ncbi:MAG: hypothetical protein IKC87_01125 [Clostridia bacterium]|nr:hypothetical protein [Clostridia bacterium]
MKKLFYLSLLLISVLLVILFASCSFSDIPSIPNGAIDATNHGLSPYNTASDNSKALQALIDSLSEDNGGIVFIPRGEYYFSANGTQTIGSHCIKMRSNVSIMGDGVETVLKPTGESLYGLDMFYFNDYLDTGDGIYLENCNFENFTIDAEETTLKTYTSAGKGFMFNLFRNCHWNNVTVKNTDATGFGVDCPIDSSIINCVAIGCGKAADEDSGGASGFGIGYGFANGEDILIKGCDSRDNKKFGFFFEHQGRFNSLKYSAYDYHCFEVADCTASGNLYNYGGICAADVSYTSCTSLSAKKYGFYFENSTDSNVISCESKGDLVSSFAILKSDNYDVKGICIDKCRGISTRYGVRIMSAGSGFMSENTVESCDFSSTEEYTIYTSGHIVGLALYDNMTDLNINYFADRIDSLENRDNSWN